MPPEPVLMQKCSVHIAHVPGNVYNDTALIKIYWHIYIFSWPDKWPGRFYRMVVKAPLALDTSAPRISVKKSIFPHPGAGYVCLPLRSLKKT